ncbi:MULTISPECIES: sensor histidine kinase [Sphingobium]|uniref:histidine kinase n=1 Tax=Sphingobium chungbukense TaxID=56193 RepID=A0A0M3AQM0_9SPHN|nr:MULTISPECIES: histidine kinase dimerization/phosphoacceptor domain -containing protein [Sphingobium]KKW92203.1 histidine kinase [Sphingobium chungbukense]PJG48944.1 histidine kinase [Sphingobium sp. LB126]
MQRRNERFVERLPLVLRRPWQAYFLTTCLCLTALAIRSAAEIAMPMGYPFVSFFPAVILSSFLFGVRPGIYAGLLCGLLSWYFFIPPRMGFSFQPSVILALAFYGAVVAIDVALIHFLQKANFNLAVERERSRVLAENRELLFHELQHRVSNNLQVVAAMLSLQRRHVDHDLARRALDDASARLALVGRISRALYNPSGEGQNIRAFLTTLTADVVEASGRGDISMAVEAPEDLILQPDVAVPLALIVTEAVSNAIEHGLPHRGGSIHVGLDASEEGIALHITDDGNGISSDFDHNGATNLGLRISNALAGQLNGRFSLKPSAQGGAIARLDLPARL